MKEVMREELGVSPGIYVANLDTEVQRICRVRADEKARLLVTKLPDPAKDAAANVGNEEARTVTAVLAEQFDQLSMEKPKTRGRTRSRSARIPPPYSETRGTNRRARGITRDPRGEEP